jgi:TonB family protein
LIKHSDIENWLRRDSFIQDDLAIADVAAYAIRGSGADAFVTATLSASTDKSTIAVMLHVYDVRKDGEPVTILATIPFTPDLNALIETPSGTQNATPATGKNGFSLPSCVYCPAAEFTAEGVKAHFSGMAVLAATIEPNGRASQIRIVTGIPYGLDAPAISAVRKWRFQPAKDSNGHPVAVLQTIEIMFHSAS